MERIIELRNDPLEGEYYMDLLDDLLKTVVGATKFKENRCERHLSEWFTITDEAFLLLCLENYWQQWHYEWMVSRIGPPNEEPAPEVTNPRYTGKTRGTKRSWSREGMERFNNLAVLVYNDRRERGEDFDEWFLREMIESHGNRNRNAGRENIEAVINAAPTIVYNEFNMQLLIAHAQHRQPQPPAAEEEDIDRVQQAV
jgi:hypothetical protein